MPVPLSVRTARLLLRPWHPDDAKALGPLLLGNQAHFGNWIPRHVSAPASVEALTDRLAGYSAAFATGQVWRYALFFQETGVLLGEVGLYPRDASARVRFAIADRVEIGYWLRSDLTGQGLMTEAVAAVLEIARAIPSFEHAQIRCDARNGPSAGIPRRLGFALAGTETPPVPVSGEAVIALQVWKLNLRDVPNGRA